VAEDWSRAELDARDAALCAFAEKLTRAPATMEERDVEGLRAAGFDDPCIHSAVQVVSYFNYINRIADATHVPVEEGMEPYPR
jgi:uncharacterized peroxidase-related enzyme